MSTRASANPSVAKPITVFAPATVANVASGFDILGFAMDGIGDHVTVSRIDAKGVILAPLTGISGASAIPLEPEKNTAGLPILKMIEKYKPDFGVRLEIKKGIPLGSGMGGSAASAVGAVVAAHALFLQEGVLKKALPLDELIIFALMGEAVASGSMHADNIAPCLFGGFTLSFPGGHPRVTQLSYPKNLLSVVVHPDLRVDTKTARSVLKKDLSLKMHIEQSARLASLVHGCANSDFAAIARGLDDLVIEPQRASLIPGFFAVKAAALKAGALGASISGAGPAVFALASDQKTAEAVRVAMLGAFQMEGKISATGFISRIRATGAAVL
jgi:homoserine kinase